MTYFVTGGTGFLGSNLIDELLARKGKIYVLVRSGSKGKLKKLVNSRWPAHGDRIIPVTGDMAKGKLGVSAKVQADLKGKVKHFFHLAAIYDIADTDLDRQTAINVDGTRNALQLAEAIGAKCFHHTSSIAAAGLYRGSWREDMYEEWEENPHPYFATKHDSEKVVREEANIPWRIYRPGIVVGRSDTGEIDKIDGPYFFFKALDKIRGALPRWVPLVGIEGGKMNIVPVDYVVKAMDVIAHQTSGNGKAYHLTADNELPVGEVLNILADAADAPQFAMRIDAQILRMLPTGALEMLGKISPVRRIIDGILDDFGVPRDVMKFVDYPTSFDNRETRKALKGSGVECPPLEDYAPILWDYWKRNLDPDLFKDRSLAGAVRDKVVLITGASSGIGQATAYAVAEAGAKVVLCARTPEKLEETRAEVERRGGTAFVYQADVSDMESCDALIDQVIEDLGGVDILVNNAGRSIRRSISLSYDRFHDFERTMQLNYFGALRLILRVLPSMSERKAGHIINISSIGVQVNQPRFSAYVASKAALDAFSRCAQPEFLDRNVHFTNVYMPLVRTPMIAPTDMYNYVPTLSPEEAADMVTGAIRTKPKRVATRLGTSGELMWAIAPKILDIVFNTAYRLFPDSSAAKGEGKKGDKAEPSAEAMAFAALTKGIHW